MQRMIQILLLGMGLLALGWGGSGVLAAPQFVTMSVVVTLPPSTPAADTIFITGNFQQPTPWDPGATPLTRSGSQATGSFVVPAGSTIEFKFTRGSWETVEKGAQCEEITNRTAQPQEGGTLTATVAAWRDLCKQEPPVIDPRVQPLTIESAVLGVSKTVYVYTPPGYAENPTTRYPALYLFRGHETEWLDPNEDGTRGGQNVLDVYETLFAAEEVGPMILVFPGISSADNSLSGFLTDFRRPDLVSAGDQPSVGTGRFESYFITEVIPQVDASYRTLAHRWGRGVDGFSLGGFMSAKIAAQHPTLFASAGAYDGTFLFADDSCQGIADDDGLFHNPAYNALFDPVFGPLPRDEAHAAANNAPSLVCQGDAQELRRITWLIQYGPESAEPQVNYYRGSHFLSHLAAKDIPNGIAPTVLTGGHNWRTADEHMRQTLPLHYEALRAPTVVTGTTLGTAPAPFPWQGTLAGVIGVGAVLARLSQRARRRRAA